MKHFYWQVPNKVFVLIENNESIAIVGDENKNESKLELGKIENQPDFKTIDFIMMSPCFKYLLLVVNGKFIIAYKFCEGDHLIWQPFQMIETNKKIVCIAHYPSINNENDNQKLCFYGQTDGDIYKWNYLNNESEEISGHFSYLTSMIISPCGKYLVSGDRDCTIRVVSLEFPFEIVTFCAGHSGSITSIAIINNSMNENSMIVSTSAFGEVFLWDFLTGKILDQLKLTNDENDENGKTNYTDTIKCEENTNLSNCINDLTYDEKHSTIFCIVEKFVGNELESHDVIVALRVDKENKTFIRSTIVDISESSPNCSYGQLMSNPNDEKEIVAISYDKKLALTTFKLDFSSAVVIKLISTSNIYEWIGGENKGAPKVKHFKSFSGFRFGLNIPPRKRYYF